VLIVNVYWRTYRSAARVASVGRRDSNVRTVTGHLQRHWRAQGQGLTKFDVNLHPGVWLCHQVRSWTGQYAYRLWTEPRMSTRQQLASKAAVRPVLVLYLADIVGKPITRAIVLYWRALCDCSNALRRGLASLHQMLIWTERERERERERESNAAVASQGNEWVLWELVSVYSWPDKVLGLVWFGSGNECILGRDEMCEIIKFLSAGW